MVSPEAPFPALGGGAQRIASLLHYFAGRGSQVHLLTFQECEAPRQVVQQHFKIPLPPNGRSLSARVLRNASRLVRGVPPLIDRLAGFETALQETLAGQHYDLIVLEHFWLAPYVETLRQYTRQLFCDLHNIESSFFESLGNSEVGLLGPAKRMAHHRFARLCRQLEAELLPRFDGVFVTSRADAERLRPLGLGPKLQLYPNAIAWHEPRTEAKQESIVFSGNLEYHPNQQAVAWFAAAIWPLLRAEFPTLHWRLVGMHPEAVRPYVAGLEGVTLVGPVEDALAEIAQAKVSVVPLLSGSGTRIKILEAWAAGTPVVSTALGAEGLDGAPGEHLLLADDPRSFAEAVGRLLREASIRQQMARQARQLYEERYHWRAAWQELDASALAKAAGQK